MFLSCCNRNTDNNLCDILDIEQAVGNIEVLNLSKYSSEIKYIPLETSQYSLLGDAGRLHIRKLQDKFFIYETPMSMHKCISPKCFDVNGKFLYNLGTNGRANNEFLSINDVIVNDDRKEIIICDIDKLLIYGPIGNYIRSCNLQHNFILDFDGCCSNKDTYLYVNRHSASVFPDKNNQRSDELIIMDTCGKIICRQYIGKHLIIKSKNKQGIGIVSKRAELYNSNEYIRLLASNDTLFSINPNNFTCTPEYFINFGKYSSNEFSLKARIMPGENTYFETDKFLSFSVLFNLSDFPDNDVNYRIARVLYDKVSKSIQILKYSEEQGIAGFENDIDNGAYFYPQYIKDGKMYQIVNAIDFISFAKKCTSPHMKGIAAQLKEDSNPVVIEVTLK